VARETVFGVLDEARDAVAVAGQRLEDLVGVAREVGEHLVLLGEDPEDLVRRAQGRVRAADRLVEVRAAAGQAGAELVEDDRQALALGQARDVVDQVDVDRLGGALDRQQVLARAALALGDLAQRRRRLLALRARLRRRALDVLLADERLRADRALRVGAEVLERGLGDLEHDRSAVVVGHVELVDLADVDAGDADVLPGDEREGVVEDRADLVARGVGVVAGPGAEHRDHGGRREHERDDEDAPSWPGQHQPLVAVEAVVLEGGEPSAAAWVAAPGQRLLKPVCRPSSRSSGSCGVSRPPPRCR
jgi:hypothetical protein